MLGSIPSLLCFSIYAEGIFNEELKEGETNVVVTGEDGYDDEQYY